MDKPKATPIRVALNRLRTCPDELCDRAATAKAVEKTPADASLSKPPQVESKRHTSDEPMEGVWKNRLRSRKCPVRDDVDKDGDM